MRLSARNCALAILVALCVSTPAQAERADRNKPIHLEADRVTVDDAKQLATFTGNVVLTQGTLVMRGNRMEVRQGKDGFRQGVMWGNLAYFRQKREGSDEHIEGWAERIEYDGRADKVQMFNRAMLKRGEDEVRGSYISYDSNTEFFQVDGSKSANGRPGDGRVRVILQPKPRDTGATRGSLPLKSDTGGDVGRGELDGPGK